MQPGLRPQPATQATLVQHPCEDSAPRYLPRPALPVPERAENTAAGCIRRPSAARTIDVRNSRRINEKWRLIRTLLIRRVQTLPSAPGTSRLPDSWSSKAGRRASRAGVSVEHTDRCCSADHFLAGCSDRVTTTDYRSPDASKQEACSIAAACSAGEEV